MTIAIPSVGNAALMIAPLSSVQPLIAIARTATKKTGLGQWRNTVVAPLAVLRLAIYFFIETAI